MFEDIKRFPAVQRKSPFHIQMCGVSYCDGTYLISRPRSSVCCIEYILCGRGTVQVGNTVFTAKAGDIYILPARHNHFYYSDAEDPWIKIWFNISGELAERLFASYDIENIFHITNLPIYPLFREFIDTANAASDAPRAEDACALVLLKIVQAISAHVHMSKPSTPTLAQRLKDKIDSMTDFAADFDALLSDLYCTKSHIIRLFKAQFGVTPYSYLLQKKLSHAKMLLENSALPIRDIAAVLGFKDSHYFSNFFKKQLGTSPQQYRKSKQQQP